MVRLEGNAAGTILLVRAQPGARHNAVLGEHDGALRVAVTAAPDKGKANHPIVPTPENGTKAYQNRGQRLFGGGLTEPLPL